MSKINLEVLLFNKEQDANAFAHLLTNSNMIRSTTRYVVYATTYGWKVRQEKFIKKYQYWV